MPRDPDRSRLTTAQEEELRCRLAASDRGEVRFSTWEEVKRRLLREE